MISIGGQPFAHGKGCHGQRDKTLFAGANVRPGEYSENINHYSVLHTLEEIYDIPVTDTTHAEAITDVWKDAKDKLSSVQ